MMEQDIFPSAVDGPLLLLRLPPELLSVVVDASASPLRTYLRLLSLCRATRTAVRGTPRELSFIFGGDDDELVPEGVFPTPDALAALVGPCKGLVELTLPAEIDPSICHREEVIGAPWVSEAFTGHDHLAVLKVPAAAVLMPTLPNIVGCLPGLEELHLGGPDLSRHTWWHQKDAMAAYLHRGFCSFLGALSRSCPRLRALHHTMQLPGLTADDLLPIAGQLTDLQVPDMKSSQLSAHFLESLTSVQRLTLGWCPDTLLHSVVASRLTQLRLRLSDTSPGLAGVAGLCRLETLQVSLWCNPSTAATFGRLLDANMNTLRTVLLAADCDGRAEGPIQASMLLDPLSRLPHLTALTVTMNGVRGGAPPSPGVVIACLTPGLLDRLEHLTVDLGGDHDISTISTIRVAGRRPRTLHLAVHHIPLDLIALELACPRLEKLALPEGAITYPCPSLGGLMMDCPQLSSIEGFPRGVTHSGHGHAQPDPGACAVSVQWVTNSAADPGRGAPAARSVARSLRR
ncbi:hypothetical protein PAPYR_4769 [Paratrimastix pyriformis]|uniref:F-box domain-containing protein n=1 Tax=Paratrimastix pyriformis TaxID=342808 RepID=A0ABQ8UJ35_9EUKA|nr:hypothetical protein PAPYR_4769 [Paratrimastix pyriformis]